jgi:hypothetical protein
MEEGRLERSDSNDVLTVSEVARRLRCSKAHVSNLINGKVEGVAQAYIASLKIKSIEQNRFAVD